MSKDSATIETRISKWLESQGYPLEMFVAQSFKEIGQVIQSDFYTDPVTGKLREIDVKTYCTTGPARPDHEHFIQVGCTIECKLARDKPWILFTTQPDFDGGLWLPTLAVGSKLGEWLLHKMASRDPSSIPAGFDRAERIAAYGITQAFTDGLDVPFQAVNSAFKAANAWAAQIDRDNESSSERVSYSCICFPTVVIDGRLFECLLDGDDRTIVREVKSGILAWKQTSDDAGPKTIYIFTRPAVSELVQKVEKATDALQVILAKQKLFSELIEARQRVYPRKQTPSTTIE